MTHFTLKEERDRAMNIYDAAKVLGITGDITPEDVKAAYRAACKKYHPDVNPAGDEMMKLVNAAYDVLKEFSGVPLKDKQADYGDALNAALNGIFGLPGLVKLKSVGLGSG
jgi:DnaJ-class molecular chaperone